MSQVAIPIYVIAKMHNWFNGDGKKKFNLIHHEAKVLQWVPEIVGEAFTRSPKEADGSRIAGVRVDKIFVLSASVNKDARETRSYTRNVKSYLPNADSKKDLPITSINKYLPRYAVWDGNSVAEANRERQNRVEVEVLKGMLPVEFKVQFLPCQIRFRYIVLDLQRSNIALQLAQSRCISIHRKPRLFTWKYNYCPS